MAKRIFSLITMVAMMVSFCAINANAVVYMNYDFSDPALNLADGKLFRQPVLPQEVAYEMSIDDGAYYIHKDVGAEGSKNDIQQSFYFPVVVPKEDRTEMTGAYHHADETKRYYLMSDTQDFVLEYDVMIPDMTMFKESDALLGASYSYTDFYFNGFRLSWNIYPNRIKMGSGGTTRQFYFNQIFTDAANEKDLDAFEGKWMTIAHHFWYDNSAEHQDLETLAAKYTYWKCDTYVKPMEADDWTLKLDTYHGMTIHNNDINDYMRFFCYPQLGLDMKIDNIRVVSGSNLTASEVLLDGEDVASVAEVTAGEITATAEVTSAVKTEGLRKIMVAYDKTGKMIDFSSGTQNLGIGTTAVTGTLDLDATEAAAVADGGYVGLYLWDGMLPFMNAVELK